MWVRVATLGSAGWAMAMMLFVSWEFMRINDTQLEAANSQLFAWIDPKYPGIRWDEGGMGAALSLRWIKVGCVTLVPIAALWPFAALVDWAFVRRHGHGTVTTPDFLL
jgi:hypothetical protein